MGQSKARQRRTFQGLARSALAVSLRHGWAGSMLALPLLAVPQWAQAQATRSYNIPAGPLEDALNRFGREAGLLLSFSTETTAGLSSRGLQGNHAAREGLEALLGGSGLEALLQPNGSYVVRKRPAGSAEAGAAAVTLAPVTVTAQALKDGTTEGTGSYSTRSTNAATRMDLSLRETPQSVSVITRQQMDDQAMTRLDDALNQTPGVVVRSKSSDDGEGSNALYTYARGSQITNYQIDGVPTTYTGLSADLAGFDRIEVVRGATGLLNGPGNPSAALNLVRKRPTQEFAGSLKLSAGSWNRARVEGDVSGPLSEDGRVRGRLVGVVQDNHSYIDRLRDQRDLVYGVLEVDLTRDTLLTLGGSYQRDRIDGAAYWLGVGRGLWTDGTVIDYDRSFNPATNWSYFNRDTRELFASIEHKLDNGWLGKLAYRNIDRKVDELLGYAGNGYPDRTTGQGVRLWISKWPYTEKQNTVDAYASGPFSLFGRQHQLVVGATLSRNVRTDENYPGWTGPTGYNLNVPNILTWNGDMPVPDFTGTSTGNYSTTTEQAGVFGSARFKPTDTLSLIVGGRVSNWKEDARWIDDSHVVRRETGVLVPYLGAVYDLTPEHAVYASYTGIFNPQSVQDASGQYLDPERGTNQEIGFKSSFLNGRLNTSVALFQARKDKLAVADGDAMTPAGEQAYVAADDTRTRGYELELTGELMPRWQMQAGYTHAVARASDGSRLLTDTPDDMVKLFSTYRFAGALQNLTLGGGITWMSRTYTVKAYPVGNPTTAAQAAWTTVDAMAAYAFTPKWTLSVNARNIFDRKYFASTHSLVYGAPRSVMLSLTAKF